MIGTLAQAARTPIEDMATRRQFLGLAASAGLLTACGSVEKPPEPVNETRGFVDVTGQEVTVPNLAKRIVATNDQNAGAQLLSLGAPVVGIASREGAIDPSIKAYFDVAGMTTVGEHYEPNVERIIALRPDLIVHEGYEGKVSIEDATLAKLRAIAPVVGIDAFRPIEEVMSDHARLLGPAALARLDQQQADFDAALSELKAVLGDRWSDVTISFVVSNGDALEAWAVDGLGETDVLSRLGVGVVPLMEKAALPENGGYLSGISLERIPEFSADIVLVDTSYLGKDVLSQPLFKQLPAARAGQIVEIDSSMSAAHLPGYVAFVRSMITWLDGRTLRTDLV